MMGNDLIVWSPGVTLESIERQVIQKAFDYYKGNKSATARALNIAPNTLNAKLEKYDTEGKEAERLAAEQKERDELQLLRSRGMAPAQHDTAAKPAPTPTHGLMPAKEPDAPAPAQVKKTPSTPEPVKYSDKGRKRA